MTVPLLFAKRRPAAPSIARQYAGTDTEMDPKDNLVRTLCARRPRRHEAAARATQDEPPAPR